MPRGGARPGAGRPRKNPDAPAKAKKAGPAAAKKKAADKPDLGRGLTLPNGEKSPDAPAGWPFGTTPAAKPAEPKDQLPACAPEETPLEFLLGVMRNPEASVSARIQAAVQAAPYVHPKLAPAGKKEAKQAAAKGAAGGRFASATPPKLAAAHARTGLIGSSRAARSSRRRSSRSRRTRRWPSFASCASWTRRAPRPSASPASSGYSTWWRRCSGPTTRSPGGG